MPTTKESEVSHCNQCFSAMDLVERFDSGPNGNLSGKGKELGFHSICYNLYICPDCGAICKEDVWDNEGKLWVYDDNSTYNNRIALELQERIVKEMAIAHGNPARTVKSSSTIPQSVAQYADEQLNNEIAIRVSDREIGELLIASYISGFDLASKNSFLPTSMLMSPASKAPHVELLMRTLLNDGFEPSPHQKSTIRLMNREQARQIICIGFNRGIGFHRENRTLTTYPSKPIDTIKSELFKVAFEEVLSAGDPANMIIEDLDIVEKYTSKPKS